MRVFRVAALLVCTLLPLHAQRAPTPRPPDVLMSPCGISADEAVVRGVQVVRVPQSALGFTPCTDTLVLEPEFRRRLSQLLARMHRGGWDAMVFETVRTPQRQAALCEYGRTRPGRKVTNACGPDAWTRTVHGYGMAVDVVSRSRGWEHPRFFHWLMIHAEAVGLTAGAAWKKFPDQPHVQTGRWDGAPPAWARELLLQQRQRALIWARVAS